MPIWIPDNTGRFAQRPKYTPEELEATCDCAMPALLLRRSGDLDRAVTEDDLTTLIESMNVEL